MIKYGRHFKTISKHKGVVMKLCFKCGIYKRGLLHDLSKFGKTEFFRSAKHFQGGKSPINVEKEKLGWSLSWQHHKGHNPHHWEHGVDNLGTYKNTPVPIPFEYIAEMICDGVGAGIVYSKNNPYYNKPYSVPHDYYMANIKDESIFRPFDRLLIEHMLSLIKKHGINHTCEVIREYNKDRLIGIEVENEQGHE